MGYRSNLEEVDVVVRRETALAWGVADPNGSALIWIPKRMAELEGGDPPSCKGTLTAPDWFLRDKGLT